jgi:hypothetical protein
MRLIFRADGAQVRLAEDQRPVDYLAAQRADEAFNAKLRTKPPGNPIVGTGQMQMRLSDYLEELSRLMATHS